MPLAKRGKGKFGVTGFCFGAAVSNHLGRDLGVLFTNTLGEIRRPTAT